jgi:dihydropteroate synthase
MTLSPETPHPLLMGVLNITPDSFSDGGQFSDADHAVAHGLQLARDGAAIIDVGGESTRPGSERINADEQIQRVVEPIRRLRLALNKQGFEGVTISIDTTLSPVARAALDAGAGMLNDVSAGREDEAMFSLSAERGVPIVLMHMLGSPGTMQVAPAYDDVVADVLAFLIERADAAVQAGVAREMIWLDPGIGFGKTLDHNLALLGSLARFVETGYRVLLGVSRKRFIAGCCHGFAQPGASERLPGTLAANLIGAQTGVHALRIHDVAEHRQALAVLCSVELNIYRTG